RVKRIGVWLKVCQALLILPVTIMAVVIIFPLILMLF
ncbi:MAG: hypothetical protein ACI8WB_004310, partial [Phenylobacterium sp.]